MSRENHIAKVKCVPFTAAIEGRILAIMMHLIRQRHRVDGIVELRAITLEQKYNSCLWVPGGG